MFVLLVYWVYRADLELLYKLQMERWDRTVLYINATSVDMGPKYLQLLGMHALSGYHLVSIWQREDQCAKYPACSRLPMCWVTYHTHRSGRGNKVCASRDINGVSLLQTLHQKKTPKVMALPPTSANLLQLALRAHLQTMLWKEADHQGPPNESADNPGRHPNSCHCSVRVTLHHQS